MKRFAIIFFLLLPCSCFCQNSILAGSIKGRGNFDDLSFFSLLLKQNDTVVRGGASGVDGIYKIERIPPGKYALYIVKTGYRDAFMDSLTFKDGNTVQLDLLYPPPCEYHQYTADEIPRCSYGHTNHLIPVRYGLPGKKMMRLAHKGKIWLGGCVMYDCRPRYYCTVHHHLL